jgi:hypothetical protein
VDRYETYDGVQHILYRWWHEKAERFIAEGDDPQEPAWGEAVEGVQARLRAEKAQWKAGETPELKANVRNNGNRELFVAQAQQLCELEVDGKWHPWVGDIDVTSSAFGPGREYKDIRITLDDHWHTREGDKPLRLEPGKHTIRVAFIAPPSAKGQGGPVRAVSNPVEIEILALLPGSGMPLEGAMNGGYAFVGVCEAITVAEAKSSEIGVYDATQRFRVRELLLGEGPPGQEIELRYRFYRLRGREERAIEKGEQMIWIVRKDGEALSGTKALADTPVNRGAIKAWKGQLVADPVAAIKAALPKGWVVQKVEDTAHPFHLEKGNGKAVYIGPPLETVDLSKVKTVYSAVVWIMPPDYRGRPVSDGTPQAAPSPRRLIATRDAVLYWWGWPPEDVKAAILNAIFVAAD